MLYTLRWLFLSTGMRSRLLQSCWKRKESACARNLSARCSNYQVFLLLIFLACIICAYCICIMVSVIVVNEWWYFLPYCYITGDAATLALWTVNEGGQSKLEACAQMSRCCFHNSLSDLFVFTCILHNKTLSTFTKMCKYLSRNRKKLVEKVLEGHSWFYWYGQG